MATLLATKVRTETNYEIRDRLVTQFGFMWLHTLPVSSDYGYQLFVDQTEITLYPSPYLDFVSAQAALTNCTLTPQVRLFFGLDIYFS